MSPSRRGRPPAEERSIPLSVRYPASLLDLIRVTADAHGETVSTWVRRVTLEALASEGAIGPLDESSARSLAPSRLSRRATRSA